MDEYLDRDALLNKLDERLKALRKANWPWDRYITGFEDAVEMVEYFAPVDVVDVRHGEWRIITDYGNGNCFGYCSACGTPQKAESATALKLFFKYCRNCGAKMDGKGDNA